MITNGFQENAILNVVNGKKIGTFFTPVKAHSTPVEIQASKGTLTKFCTLNFQSLKEICKVCHDKGERRNQMKGTSIVVLTIFLNYFAKFSWIRAGILPQTHYAYIRNIQIRTISLNSSNFDPFQLVMEVENYKH